VYCLRASIKAIMFSLNGRIPCPLPSASSSSLDRLLSQKPPLAREPSPGPSLTYTADILHLGFGCAHTRNAVSRGVANKRIYPRHSIVASPFHKSSSGTPNLSALPSGLFKSITLNAQLIKQLDYHPLLSQYLSVDNPHPTPKQPTRQTTKFPVTGA